MRLTWDRLRQVVSDLELPAGQFALGANGTFLAHKELPSASRVDLLVSHQLHEDLAREGWTPTDEGLQHPHGERLFARTGADVGPYLGELEELLAAATASPHEGVPVVPSELIDREADRARRFEQLNDVMARRAAGEDVDPSHWPRLPGSDAVVRRMHRLVLLFGSVIFVVGAIVAALSVLAQGGHWVGAVVVALVILGAGVYFVWWSPWRKRRLEEQGRRH